MFVPVVVLALVGGAVWWFAIRPAFAAADAPAVLTVHVANVSVGHAGGGYAAAHTGQQVGAQGSVKTDASGRASLLFPDGSITRMAGSTELTLTEENLTSKGALNRVTVEQQSGRTFSSVQRLAKGSGFGVKGRHVDVEVRGTEFEVYVRPDGSIQVKLFSGGVRVSGTSGGATLAAGQQVVVNPAGAVGAPGPIAPEPGDPFASWTGPTGSETAALVGNQPGTVRSMPSAAALGAVNTPVDSPAYAFAGGDLTAALSYPGSLMKLEVVGPGGQVVARGQGAAPVRLTIPNAPAGNYKARVTALNLDHGPESWTVTFAANPPCRLAPPSSESPPPGAPVRVTLSDTALNTALSQGGVTGASIRIVPSTNGGILTGSLSVVGFEFSGTAVVYASAPGVGVTFTQASANGVVNIASQVAVQLARLQGIDLASIKPSFSVDRLYSCQGPDGRLLVIEGHGQA